MFYVFLLQPLTHPWAPARASVGVGSDKGAMVFVYPCQHLGRLVEWLQQLLQQRSRCLPILAAKSCSGVDVTRSCVWRDSFTFDMTCLYVFICGMTHWYATSRIVLSRLYAWRGLVTYVHRVDVAHICHVWRRHVKHMNEWHDSYTMPRVAQDM